MCGGVENVEAVEVGAEVGEAVHRMMNRTSHLLKVAVHGRHFLHLLRPLLLNPFVLLIQLHVPLLDLLELPLHRFVQCIDLIMDVLHVGTSRPSSKHRAWRV